MMIINNTIEYRGYIIRTEYNKEDKNYPFIAVGRKGFDEIIHRGYDEQQAINLVKGTIDFTIAKQELDNKS